MWISRLWKKSRNQLKEVQLCHYLLRAGWEVGCNENDSDVTGPLVKHALTGTYHIYQTKSTNHLTTTCQKWPGLSTTTFCRSYDVAIGVQITSATEKEHQFLNHIGDAGYQFQSHIFKWIYIRLFSHHQKGKHVGCPPFCRQKKKLEEIIVWYWNCWMASRWFKGVVIPYKFPCPIHQWSWSRINHGFLDGQCRNEIPPFPPKFNEG